MNRGAFFLHDDRHHGGAGSAWIIAILFALIAAISFAVDQTLMLMPPPGAPASALHR